MNRLETRAPERRPAWRSPFVLVSAAAVVVAVVVIVVTSVKPPSTDAGLIVPAVSYPEALIDGEAVVGVVFGAYFMYLQVFVIGAVCIWCTTHGLSLVLRFVIALAVWLRQARA